MTNLSPTFMKASYTSGVVRGASLNGEELFAHVSRKGTNFCHILTAFCGTKCFGDLCWALIPLKSIKRPTDSKIQFVIGII